MSDFSRIMLFAKRLMQERLFSTRMYIMLPILLLFIPGMAWGFSDPNIILPGGHQPDTAMEVLFYASLGVVFGATMCAVLLSYDSVSRERASGVLELRLAQPMPRSHQAIAMILGSWRAILIPTWILLVLSVLIVRYRIGEWLSIIDCLVYFSSTALILLWYVLFTLLASSYTREQGTAISFGIGLWFLFTFLWALVTTMVAYASGVSIGQENDAAWIMLEGGLDLLSPNGVYHHLLETRLPQIDRGVAVWQSWAMALAWTILPSWLFVRRMEKILP
ncbi:MAG: ABC transporter permease [Euryarchaeota archaeon]|jgi:ABC-type transport system involved in multi-copper enzyme maturation permease subunit|nr:ABC transporter permease [Euryarchaeota archaeon]HJL97971.1 ABC transporter permease [Candidatus Poseidoniaceae archaeon]MBT5844936.1 ABC transporter permease [Euryarchaeota archaeon]MBT6640532.1 ABC transporter permease [Euryarchaeota archaeon]MBT6844544.1 ABC transporter permease [Euryarchaeota archaeon]